MPHQFCFQSRRDARASEFCRKINMADRPAGPGAQTKERGWYLSVGNTVRKANWILISVNKK